MVAGAGDFHQTSTPSIRPGRPSSPGIKHPIVLKQNPTRIQHRCDPCITGLTIDAPTHRRIAAKAIGVVDALMTGKVREDQLTHEGSEIVTTLRPGSRITVEASSPVSQTYSVVKFTVAQQTAVRTD